MRKSKQEAAETRQRIVESAASAFRHQGIGATGLADLMKGAGLTHGGFYKHFASKDQLVAEAYVSASLEMLEQMEGLATVGEMVRRYLSTQHRDNPAQGCPLSAIGSELARSDPQTREVVTEAFVRFVGVVSTKYEGGDARRRALATISAMFGALSLARIVADPALSDEILKAVEADLASE